MKRGRDLARRRNAVMRELPGYCLSLIAPSGRLSAPSVTIDANVDQLLPQQSLDLTQSLDLSLDRRRARGVLGSTVSVG